MAMQYWINNYFIDRSRNQINHQAQSITLPAKALSVLTILAENSPNVVSHDEIMDKVWPNAVVSPNTLQRNIAQLRKAFGDDSKQQAFIKTHAKQGYSLCANVRWQNIDSSQLLNDEQPAIQTEQIDTQPKVTSRNLYALATLSAVLLSLVCFWLWPVNQQPLSFKNVKPLTATDEREFTASYSPDGRFLVFSRVTQSCKSHLWAKDLTTKQEHQLTETPGIFGSHSWSQDGNQLVMAERNECGSPDLVDNMCWSVKSLDFANALTQPQATTMRLNCHVSRTAVARWLWQGHIGFLQQSELGHHVLKVYNPREDNSTPLYTPSDTLLYSYDYSFAKNQFAIVERTASNRHILKRLNQSGAVLSSVPITLHAHHSSYEYININYHPSGEYVLTILDDGLYKLQFDGQLQKINTLDQKFLLDARFNPTGDKIVATQANSDIDVSIVAKADLNQDTVQPRIFARSNVSEQNAKKQPNGPLIAYVSVRSGKRQVWLYNNGKSTQLSHFEFGLASDHLVWSPSGEAIAVVYQDKITLIDLTGKIKQLDLAMPVQSLFQWTANDTLLIAASDDSSHLLFSIQNVSHTQHLTQYPIHNIEWAQVTKHGHIVVTDAQKKLSIYSLEGKRLKLNPALNKQLVHWRIAVFDNSVYGINHQHELWRYDIASHNFQMLTQLPETALYISNITDEELLLTHVIDAKKELIEFYNPTH